ncbi:hypothetical protein NDU88_002817 [Pleurodeles waltl]|uniref:Uncharacterized protein n=1 Tax=Pleurodeles waltl TaxID=8319 RepID=A0AAV7UWQ5_PLEWA|nr:hypothetical protein NDU88_002817 [Pleurodeles waltl]
MFLAFTRDRESFCSANVSRGCWLNATPHVKAPVTSEEVIGAAPCHMPPLISIYIRRRFSAARWASQAARGRDLLHSNGSADPAGEPRRLLGSLPGVAASALHWASLGRLSRGMSATPF